jgi:hypothetical protein
MKKIVIFSLLLLQFACKQKETSIPFEGFIGNDSIVVFEPQVAEIKNDTLLAKASLMAEKRTGKVWLKVLFRNSSKIPLKADPFLAQISNSQGIRSQVMEVSDTLKTIHKGEIVEYQLAFQPINSLNLYRLAQLKGDLSQTYQIPLDFVSSNQGTNLTIPAITFQMKDSVYQAYLSKYGKDKNLKIYQLGEDFTNFQSELIKYLNKNVPLVLPDEEMKKYKESPKQHNVSINEQEMMIDGLVIKLLCYSNAKNTYLNLQLINHSYYPIALNVNELIFLQEKDTYTPTNIGEDKFQYFKKIADNQMIAILKGERFQYLFEFDKVFQENNTLSLKGLKIGEKLVPIFNNPLKMKKVDF